MPAVSGCNKLITLTVVGELMTDRHGTSRRQWLAACAGGTASIAGLAGCLDGGDGSGDGDDPSDGDGTGPSDDSDDGGGRSYDASQPSGWPMRGANPEATGYQSEATGPQGDVNLAFGMRVNFSEGEIDAPPAVQDGTLYLNGTGDTTWAIDVESEEVIWRDDYSGGSHSPIVHEGTVYVLGDGYMSAIDAASGERLWSQGDVDLLSAPLLYDGAVYAVIDGGPLLVRWAVGEAGGSSGPEPETIHEFDGVDHVGGLAVHDGTAFVTADDSVRAVALGGSGETWSFSTDTGGLMEETAPSTDGYAVYATAADAGVLHAIDAASGEELWQFSRDAGSLGNRPSVDEDRVYVQDGGQLWALDPSDGTELWNASTAGYASPTVADGLVYVQVDDGPSGRAIDAASGDLAWEMGTVGQKDSPMPVIADGICYLTGPRGHLAGISGV